MSRLVGIDFCRAIEALGCFSELPRAAIKVEQFEQRGAVIVLTIGRVVKFAEKLQNLRRSPMRRRDVFHDRDELPALSAAPLELFQLARQRHGGIILLTLQQTADE